MGQGNDQYVGLCIGAGSIGMKHLSILERFFPVAIVELNRSLIGELNSRHSPSRAFAEVDDAFAWLQNFHPTKTIIGVIANWGPGHRSSFDSLVENGVRRILIEKPLATSLVDVAHISRTAENLGVRLLVGHQLRYTGTRELVHLVGRQHLSSKPLQVVVHGGAQCLITNGSHWLDFACMLFGSLPERVWSNAHTDPINPRSAKLTYWAGTSVWEFSQQRELAITYTNTSSVAQVASIYFRNGRIDIEYSGKMRVFRRDADEVKADSRVTRVGEGHEVLIGEIPPIDVSEALETQIACLLGNEMQTYSVGEACQVASALLGALAAAQLGHSLDLPIAQDMVLFDKDWLAS